MRYLLLVITVILAFFLQITLFPSLAILDVSPNLLLIVVIGWGIAMGIGGGCVAGGLAGIFLDIIAGGPYIQVLSFLLVGAGVGWQAQNLKGNPWVLSVGIIFCGTFVAGLTEIILILLFRGTLPSLILLTWLLSLFFNVFLTPIIFTVYKKVYVS